MARVRAGVAPGLFGPLRALPLAYVLIHVGNDERQLAIQFQRAQPVCQGGFGLRQRQMLQQVPCEYLVEVLEETGDLSGRTDDGDARQRANVTPDVTWSLVLATTHIQAAPA